jgi:hypothetical protein
VVKVVQGWVVNHVLTFSAEDHTELGVNTCIWLEGEEWIMRMRRHTESVFFVVQMFDDMVILPTCRVGAIKAYEWTRRR